MESQDPQDPMPPQEMDIQPDPDPAPLRALARNQRRAIYLMLAYVVLVLVCAGLPEVRASHPLLGGIAIGLGVVTVVVLFRLAWQAYNLPVAIICCVLAFAPCLGLLIIAGVNGKATQILKKHGIKVGFLGADPSKI